MITHRCRVRQKDDHWAQGGKGLPLTYAGKVSSLHSLSLGTADVCKTEPINVVLGQLNIGRCVYNQNFWEYVEGNWKGFCVGSLSGACD